MVTDISGQNSSQAVQDLLGYVNALWNTSYILSSTKQEMACKVRNDTIPKSTINTHYEELRKPKNGHHCRKIPLGSVVICKTNIRQISRRMTEVNITQI